MTVQDVYQAIDQAAPFSLAMDFDNVGLLVGDPNAQVRGVLVALDVTAPIIAEAKARGANLIVTHHPVIFHPMKRITADSFVYQLIESGISVISAHTNLDIATGGVNDVLAEKLGFLQTEPLAPENMIRIGQIERGMTPPEFAYYVKRNLGLEAVRYCDGGRAIQRVAVCGGSGGSMLREVVAAGVQAYITGDVKHDVMLDAIQCGVTLIDAGHYGTEYPVLPYLEKLVKETVPGISVSIAHNDTDPTVTI